MNGFDGVLEFITSTQTNGHICEIGPSDLSIAQHIRDGEKFLVVNRFSDQDIKVIINNAKDVKSLIAFNANPNSLLARNYTASVNGPFRLVKIDGQYCSEHILNQITTIVQHDGVIILSDVYNEHLPEVGRVFWQWLLDKAPTGLFAVDRWCVVWIGHGHVVISRHDLLLPIGKKSRLFNKFIATADDVQSIKREQTSDTVKQVDPVSVSINRNKLPITLVCVDCVDPQLAAYALDKSRRGLRFERIILFSDVKPRYLPSDIEYIEAHVDSKESYNLFMLRKLLHYINTQYVLNVETDGYIMNGQYWDDKWLEYDYVGAPWIAGPTYASRSRVGNSGCCLRSLKILRIISELSTDDRIREFKQLYYTIPNDVFISYFIYDDLISSGMKFAPLDIAARFSTEVRTEYTVSSFGCHSEPDSDRVYERELRGSLMSWISMINARRRCKINLIINYYKDPKRQEELIEAFVNNIQNDAITRVTVLLDSGVELPIHHNKIVVIAYDGHPSFAAYAAAAIDDGLNIIINSDCYFDDSVIDLTAIADNDFACLTRYNMLADRYRLFEELGYCSQDAWAWWGQSKLTDISFTPGVPGCDNKIAWRAHEAGYNVINPSHTVRVFHNHKDKTRCLPERLPAPYFYVWPHGIGDIPVTQLRHKY